MSYASLSARAFDAGWSCCDCGARGHLTIIAGWGCYACDVRISDEERDFRKWVTCMVWARQPCCCTDPNIDDPGPSHIPACPWTTGVPVELPEFADEVA